MLKMFWRLLLACVLGALVVVLRYMLRTPQALDSKLPGESRLYRWRHGHVFYKVAGTTGAPALVLLHAPGIGASAYEMRHLMQILQQDYRVYAPDLPGFGLSDHPVIDYSAGTYISLCRDFLREVVRSPAVLMVSGLSCQYGVAVAASSPELCERLVLLAPVPLLERQRPPAWLACLAEVPPAGFVLYALITARPLLRKVLESWDMVVSNEELDYRYAVAHQLGAQRAVLALLAGKLDTDVSRQLTTLRLPVLTVWGSKFAPVQQSIPGDVAVIQETGLAVHEEAPRSIVDLLRERTASPELPAANLDNVAHAEVPASTPALATIGDTPLFEAYCVKCRQKRTMQDAHKVTTKKGRNALEGLCPVCNTRLFRFTVSE
ncbi:MAG: alpha/beta fold hydrolase, partial [Ktedonobacteraceae bacterium]|nr:alpha/beta fold hydrolase [Ktedonobacteraceae bacterium]